MPQPPERSNAVRSALIALGSNVTSHFGTPAVTLRQSMQDVKKDIGRITGSSGIYLTPAFPAGTGPDYVNAAIRVETELSPSNVLLRLHKIEAYYGRAREQRWGMRTLDLDLLALDDLVLPDAQTQDDWRALPADLQKMRAPDELILPHPRLQDRSFVLVPLAEIVPDWVHPLLGLTVTEMLDRRPSAERAEAVLLESS